jgi:competence protein ComEC
MVVVCALLLRPTSATTALPTGTLRVTFIDVGQGDSAWLETSTGTGILIDGGPVAAGPTVVAFLQNQGVEAIDVVVLSHGHADHIGGLVDVLQSAMPIGAVVYNGQPCSTTVCLDVWAETQSRGLTPTPAVAGQTYTWGALGVAVLNPQPTPRGDPNEDSVVLRLTYGGEHFLFPGDIGTSTEGTLLASGAPLGAAVLKVAHHGSAYSSGAPFLAAVDPDFAVISVGAGNPYGHPAPETLDRLRAAGACIFRTDLEGTLSVSTDGQTLSWQGHCLLFLPLVLR